MKTITSRTNPEVKKVTSLHQAKYRTQHNQFIAEGVRVCSTLVDAGHQPHAVYATENMLEKARTFVNENILVLVSDHVMEKISTAATPSGILCVFSIPQAPAPEQLNSGIVLVQIADPGNIGTLIRTAAAMNTQSVVIVEGVDPWSPKVVQASAGTIGYVNVFQLTWDQLITHKKDLKLYALVISGGKDPKKLAFKNALLVVGSEAHGIPPQWINDCDEKITLSMPGKIESLNAAVAGSIALYVAFTAK